MDLSGFYLSGAWADDDDDEGRRLSGTLFPTRKSNVTKETAGASYRPRVITVRSTPQPPPVNSSGGSGPVTLGTINEHPTKDERVEATGGRTPLMNSRMVTPHPPSAQRVSNSSSRSLVDVASRGPRQPAIGASAAPRAEPPRGVARASQDITIFLDLTSPKLPPPLQTPTTPEDWDTGKFELTSQTAPPPASDIHPATPEELNSLRLSSTSNVGHVPNLQTRAVTPSGAWRFDVASHQDGLRMHSSGYSPIEENGDAEPGSLPSPYLGVIESKTSFAILENEIPLETDGPRDLKPLPPPPAPTPSAIVIFNGTVCLAQAIAGVVLAQTLIPARTISDSLSGGEAREPGEMIWLSSACVLGAAAFALPAARIVDVFGYRNIFVGSLMWLMLWTELIVFGRHIEQSGDSGAAFVCTCRAMQGIGLAFLVPTSFDMLHRTNPSHLHNSMAAISGVLGFVIGGIVTCLFATSANWKWSFVSLSLIVLALGVLGMLIIPASVGRKEGTTYDSVWTRYDALGMLSSTSGMILFLVGLNLLSVVPSDTPYAYLIMVTGILLLGWFVFNQRMTLRPILPLAAFTGRAYLVLACMATYWASFSIWLWYLVQVLEHLRGWKPILISASLVPLAVIGVVSALALHIVTRIASSEMLMFAAAVLSCIGSVLMATTAVDEIYWRSTFFSILLMSPGVIMLTHCGMRLLGDNVAPRFPSSLAALGLGVATFAASTALGVAGAIERAIDKGNESNLLEYRGPQYFGSGLSGLGVVLSFVLFMTGHVRR